MCLGINKMARSSPRDGMKFWWRLNVGRGQGRLSSPPSATPKHINRWKRWSESLWAIAMNKHLMYLSFRLLFIVISSDSIPRMMKFAFFRGKRREESQAHDSTQCSFCSSFSLSLIDRSPLLKKKVPDVDSHTHSASSFGWQCERNCQNNEKSQNRIFVELQFPISWLGFNDTLEVCNSAPDRHRELILHRTSLKWELELDLPSNDSNAIEVMRGEIVISPSTLPPSAV